MDREEIMAGSCIGGTGCLGFFIWAFWWFFIFMVICDFFDWGIAMTDKI